MRSCFEAAARAAKSAKLAGLGKKAVVASAVVASAAETALDLDDPRVAETLRGVVRVGSWREARPLLMALGPAGEILGSPAETLGLGLPHAPCNHGNWGLPNVVAAATILLARCRQPNQGPGWALVR